MLDEELELLDEELELLEELPGTAPLAAELDDELLELDDELALLPGASRFLESELLQPTSTVLMHNAITSF